MFLTFLLMGVSDLSGNLNINGRSLYRLWLIWDQFMAMDRVIVTDFHIYSG